MIVFYGVKYYGKENAFVRHGRCGNCGFSGQLSSYDTASFFTVFWLPIIPLGGKHIIDACPSCKTHRELGRRKFYKVRQKEIFNAFNDLKEDQDNPEKGANALNTLVIYHDFDNFRAFAPILIKKHQHDAGFLTIMGESYEYIGDYESAEDCYTNAVAVEDTSENRLKLATNLLLQNKPDDAEPYLAHIFADKQVENINHLYLLAESYRDQGRHKEALEVLKNMASIREDIKDDPYHMEMEESSKARVSTKESIPSVVINAKKGVERTPGGLPTWVPQLLPVLLVCLIVGGYFYSAFQKGMAREIYLVSGSPVKYTARINDKEFTLPAYGYRKVTLPEGNLDIKIAGPVLDIPKQTVTVKTPFFSRPFDSRIIVLNPDGLALLLKETTVYSTREIKSYKGDFSVLYGKVLYKFTDIDYPFRDFPDEIRMDAKQDRAYRTKLISFKPDSYDQLIGIIIERMTSEELADYFEKYMLMQPEGNASLYILSRLPALSDPDRFVRFIRQGTAKRPILVDWHRTYQTFMDTHQPRYDLVAEYQKYVEAKPDDAYLEYLLGRVTPDPVAAEAHFMASENHARPIGLGYYAIAYQSLCAGRFEKALAQAGKAASIKPGRNNFQWVINRSRIALAQYKALLDAIRAQRKQNAANSWLADQEIRYLMLMNREQDAREVKTAYLQELAKVDTAENVKRVESYLDSTIYYLSGNYDGYAKSIQASLHPYGAFHAAILNKDVNGAVKILQEIQDAEATNYLLTYCVAKQNGMDQIGDKMLSKSLALLDSGGFEDRLAAKMLRGDLGEVKKSLGEITLIPVKKRIIAVTLGLTFPEIRQYCYDIAGKQNFDKEFPYETINRIIAM